jgi:DNA repair exonuclease SbcCD ATPase subunit
MIIFKTLSIENFLAFGSSPTIFELNSSKATSVSGKNGSGKSTMIDALSFALFGKAYRNVNKSDVVNTINGKGCLVSLSFSIGSDEYIVTRGIKPNIFTISKNNKLLDQEAATKDTQRVLENDILKLNQKTFNQITIISNAGFTPFLQYSASERRIVIENLMDLEIFSAMSKLAKEKTSNIIKDIANIDGKINQYKSSIDRLDSFIDKILAEEIVQDADIDGKVLLLNKQITDIECGLEILEADKKDLYATIGDAPEVSTKKSEISNAVIKMKHVMNGFITEHNFLDNNNVCESCKQTLSAAFKQEKQSTLADAINKREIALETAKTAIGKYDIRLVEINSVITEIKKLDSSITSNNNEIKNCRWKIQQLVALKTKAIVSVEDEKKEAVALRKLLLLSMNEKDVLVEDKSYLDIMTVMLKDNGIKSTIINLYIPILNRLINHYLDKMGLFVKFSFDNLFNDTIQLRHRDCLTYFSLSEGQKRKVDLGIIFALRQISESKNISHTNLIIFDDILSTIDCDGVDSIKDIINSFEGKNVFCISHNELEGCDKNIRIEMRQNYSVII